MVAKFYFDKPEFEPTRSVVIRSAAFLNLKSGLIERAQEFIFFGLLNITDEIIKSQLNNALEISVSLKSNLSKRFIFVLKLTNFLKSLIFFSYNRDPREYSLIQYFEIYTLILI